VRGELVTPERLAEMMIELQAIGCHNINWVTPEHVVPQILEALPHAFAPCLDLPGGAHPPPPAATEPAL
jgi:putative pyruvate formate lyase activating enzyme